MLLDWLLLWLRCFMNYGLYVTCTWMVGSWWMMNWKGFRRKQSWSYFTTLSQLQSPLASWTELPSRPWISVILVLQLHHPSHFPVSPRQSLRADCDAFVLNLFTPSFVSLLLFLRVHGEKGGSAVGALRHECLLSVLLATVPPLPNTQQQNPMF
jgi:hypothetical protein